MTLPDFTWKSALAGHLAEHRHQRKTVDAKATVVNEPPPDQQLKLTTSKGENNG